MQNPQADQTPVEVDTAEESDDLHEVSSLASLRSSILEHQAENGRTYHSMSAGKYSYPNDERESDRLDLQHRIWIICLKGELAISPGHKTAKRVLDMGTGTGIWAIDYADDHPSAEVIGVDLSPIQPEWAPPNCVFELDDLEKSWTWNKPFDFIYCRAMEGCFLNGPKMVKKIYQALTPGGYLEVGGLELPLGCDDDSVPKDSSLWQWHTLLQEAAEKIGRPLEGLGKETEAMKDAGFVDITRKDFVWPLNSWPADPHLKELGDWHRANLDMGIEGLSMGLLTRVLDWTREEVLALCAGVRRDLRNRRMHAYWKIHVVYARKPEKTEELEESKESEGEAAEEAAN
ncbi:Putative S-adenosyl-L-methionine-dependent methyltransferase superfamily [Colletotrichum destructivum]|uniref:S-adenosyl-L-methionine-dependent methyltransferase superfamily n=1 Tax=Colletotrichum destructivum TaxID=34406 RepID=A0AAX4IRZ2_9PEZI|nr:Putative S-adenosyl-L-methionine-dependent methyltransferase superfamily [Colletotrichum destructivum]